MSFSEDSVTSDPAMVGLATSTIEKNRVIISEEDVTRNDVFQKSVSHLSAYTMSCMYFH